MDIKKATVFVALASISVLLSGCFPGYYHDKRDGGDHSMHREQNHTQDYDQRRDKKSTQGQSCDQEEDKACEESN